SGPDAAAADPCYGGADERSRTGTGQMVQSVAWFRLPDARRGDAGYFRPHGNIAPVRHDGTAPRPVRAGALRTGPEGHDGGRSPPRKRRAHLPRAAGRLASAARFAAALLVDSYVVLAFRASAQATEQ